MQLRNTRSIPVRIITTSMQEMPSVRTRNVRFAATLMSKIIYNTDIYYIWETGRTVQDKCHVQWSYIKTENLHLHGAGARNLIKCSHTGVVKNVALYTL